MTKHRGLEPRRSVRDPEISLNSMLTISSIECPALLIVSVAYLQNLTQILIMLPLKCAGQRKCLNGFVFYDSGCPQIPTMLSSVVWVSFAGGNPQD